MQVYEATSKICPLSSTVFPSSFCIVYIGQRAYELSVFSPGMPSKAEARLGAAADKLTRTRESKPWPAWRLILLTFGLSELRVVTLSHAVEDPIRHFRATSSSDGRR